VVARSSRLLSFDFDGRAFEEHDVAARAIGSPLVLDDGSMVFSSMDSAVRRLDADGRTVFERVVGTHLRADVALVGIDRLAVAVGTELVVLSLDGRVLWRAAVEEPIVAGPAVARDDTIWVVGAAGHVLAYGPDGRNRARSELGTRVLPNTSVAVGRDGSVRLTSADRVIRCVGAGGVERWSVAQEGAFQGPLVLGADDTTFAITTTGRLVAISPDGDVRWRVETGARVFLPPILSAPGTVVVVANDGTIQALGEEPRSDGPPRPRLPASERPDRA
jgi:outer membrane protein assembly factor BamB